VGRDELVDRVRTEQAPAVLGKLGSRGVQRSATPDVGRKPLRIGDQRTEKGALRVTRGRSLLVLIRHSDAAVGTAVVLSSSATSAAVGRSLRATVGPTIALARDTAGTTIGWTLGPAIRPAVVLSC